MSVVAPPRPPDASASGDPEALEALIEEARRRARRRRRLYGASVVAALTLGAAAFFGSSDGGRDEGPDTREPATRFQPIIEPRATMNGPLTIMTAAPRSSGWYGLSTIGANGRLRPLVRCPDGVEWCGEVESVDWSPDGRWLAFSVTSVANPNPYNGIHLANPATGEDRQIRHSRPNEGQWFDLAWSRDGSRLAYVSAGTIALITFSQIVTGEMESSVLRTGTAGHDSTPSWSPDSGWIAYDSKGRHGSAIYVIGADGEKQRLLVAHGSVPAWSPNGRAIAYRSGCAIRIVTPAGDDVTPSALSGCLFGAMGANVIPGPPVWSPDGRKLAVAITWRTGQSLWRGTYVMDADGSHLRRLTRAARGAYVGQQARAAWQPLPRRHVRRR